MCELILTPNARQNLQRLDSKLQRQILDKLEWICENCHSSIHKPLKHNYKGHCKLHCKGHRVIYIYDRKTATVKVSRIENRSSVYKKRRRRK